MKRIKQESVIVLFFWLLIVSFSGLIIVFSLSSVFTPKAKELSILNYYTYPLKITFLDKEFVVDRFSILTTEVRTKENFFIEVKTEKDELVKKFEVSPVGYKQQLIVSVLSPANNYCFFGANVRDLYYTSDESLGREQITNVTTLSNTPSDYILKNIESSDGSTFVYPGNASIASLPTETKVQKIYGLYPIPCPEISSADNFAKTAKFYANYDAKDQQEYYDASKKKIDESSSSSDLQNLTID